MKSEMSDKTWSTGGMVVLKGWNCKRNCTPVPVAVAAAAGSPAMAAAGALAAAARGARDGMAAATVMSWLTAMRTRRSS